MEYEAVIGLEVHTQLITRSKMFCGCPNGFGGQPNTRVCAVCLGYPGVLPVINREAVRKTLMAGLTCGCEVGGPSKFDRKNYFYPDMPKNYQLSQYDLPLCRGGGVPISGSGFSGDPLQPRTLRLTRMHLEEDTGKLTHLGSVSGVDFNRAGIPLLEIVSEPEMHSPDEAYAFLTTLKRMMQYAGVSNCDMEKAQMRCDVNVSVRPSGETRFGEKIEVKNLNSFRAVHRALTYEIQRQREALAAGRSLRQETRGWDDEIGTTFVQRTKEDAHDYRYFPEPDLLPLEIDETWIAEIGAELPEGPRERQRRFVEDWGITPYDAAVLTADRGTADYYEAAARTGGNPKAIANWIITELTRELGERDLPISRSPVSPAALAELIGLIDDQTISGKIAKRVFADMAESGKPPKEIVAEKGLVQVTDAGAIDAFVQAAVEANPNAVREYAEGNRKALRFLVGQVMKASRGKANPRLAVKALEAKLRG